MPCSTCRTALAVLAVLSGPALAGCGAAAEAPVPVAAREVPELRYVHSSWRQLTYSVDLEKGRRESRTAGYLEARHLSVAKDVPGRVYVVYDADHRPVGQVTWTGHALRYAGPRLPEEDLGKGPLLDGCARILGLDQVLQVCDLQGAPQDLP